MSGNRYSWRDIFIPSDERRDPRFRAQIARLSLIGLRLISVIILSAIVLWFLIALLKLPEMLEFMGHPSTIAAVVLTATMLAATLCDPVRGAHVQNGWGSCRDCQSYLEW